MRFFPLLRTALALGVLLGGATACSDDDDDDDAPAASPQTITINRKGLYPEGVQYDAAGQRYFVSSLTRGAIGQVRGDSTYTLFADSPRLISTIGLNFDAGRNRLLAAVSDPGAGTRSTAATVGQLAALAIFDVPAGGAAGALTSFVDLGVLRPGQGHFANDIAVDAQGNAYVTDSSSPIIYKVDAAGTATVFYENAALATQPGQFGFNGIVFHPDGYLLVVHSTLGRLYKLPLTNSGGSGAPTATVVATSQSLMAGDGLLLLNNQTLLVAANAQSSVFRLTSSDGFATAQASGTFATGATFPTTLTRRGDGEAYVLYAYLDKIAVMPPQPTFTINKVQF
ncbi:SMP-30/gluconolactonase/LRE family protein [uncultured Hymenobacter sp.]|uniref:SMP-30/gluconolactonase/LRE family protein n=1 Tax=uncultured Hymenobacter sp. TaxID=170016 RepID=UPI0035C9825C